jgi:hypothetical protein
MGRWVCSVLVSLTFWLSVAAAVVELHQVAAEVAAVVI